MLMLSKLSVVSIVFIALSSAIVLFAIIAFFFLVPMGLWFRCMVSGTHIPVSKLVGMKFRKVRLYDVVLPFIQAKKTGLNVTIEDLETHFLAGGNVDRLIKALMSANSANINLSVQTAKAIDLAGRDVFDAVKCSVVPKVLETEPISAVAKDGIEIKARVKVTIRSNIHRLIGGASEETIIARICECVVTTIGSAVSHKDVLENPDLVSKAVFGKGLDFGTSFEILSVDVSDVEVGKNVGAQLRAEQAESDKRIAVAAAEKRRAMAVAEEQEMRVKTQEMKVNVVKAEADVPRALAESLRKGKISAEDYYNLQNIQSDTNMRNSIGGKNDDE